MLTSARPLAWILRSQSEPGPNPDNTVASPLAEQDNQREGKLLVTGSGHLTHLSVPGLVGVDAPAPSPSTSTLRGQALFACDRRHPAHASSNLETCVRLQCLHASTVVFVCCGRETRYA